MEAPEFYNQSSNDSKPTADHFIVEDLLDFSNDDDALINDVAFDSVTTHSSTVTALDHSCNSSSFSGSEPTSFNANFSDAQFSSDLCVPYDDLAELEWLSNFVEESFSSDDLQKLQLISGIKARPDDSSQTRDCNNKNSNNPIFHPEMSVPAKARSKRSRAAPCNWASRLLLLSPSTSSSSNPEIMAVPPPQHPITGKKTVKVAGPKRREGGEGRSGNGEGRKCLHCATDKTPQWRTGPLGPKTLCNACGVRYKSGRLVPEYRPAASPTFVLTKHSNSHRKVMELRRQKEQHHHHHQQFIHHHHHNHNQNIVFDHVSNGDDYLIHQHVGPDYRQLI